MLRAASAAPCPPSAAPVARSIGQVSEDRVGVGEVVRSPRERVRRPQRAGVGGDGVRHPGQLPGEVQRVAEVARDRAGDVLEDAGVVLSTVTTAATRTSSPSSRAGTTADGPGGDRPGAVRRRARADRQRGRSWNGPAAQHDQPGGGQDGDVLARVGVVDHQVGGGALLQRRAGAATSGRPSRRRRGRTWAAGRPGRARRPPGRRGRAAARRRRPCPRRPGRRPRRPRPPSRSAARAAGACGRRTRGSAPRRPRRSSGSWPC